MQGALQRHRSRKPQDASTMLKWALIAFVISLIAGALGFTGISEAAARIAKFLFVLFLILAIAVVIIALAVGQAVF